MKPAKTSANIRSIHSKKALRSSYGDIEIDVPRDREGEFEPQLVKKNQTSLSTDIEGSKDVLGMWIAESESLKYWLTVLNGLKARGVEDNFIASIDRLCGFGKAIEAAFPKTEVQRCIIHQIRGTTHYVSYKDIKQFMADLKQVYNALDEPAALASLDEFAEKWNGKHPKISKSWRENWAELRNL